MRDVLVVATIPVGLVASAAWTAFIAFELFKLNFVALLKDPSRDNPPTAESPFVGLGCVR